MILESASNPIWSSATTIDLTVKFAELQNEIVFTASPNDVESYGVDIFNRANAGEFGTVTPLPDPQE